MKAILHIAAALLATFALQACAGLGASQTPSLASDKDGRIQVPQTIVVASGKTFDGNNALYDWVGTGDCSQTEGMPPMFKLMDGASLINLRMRGAPDGIHIHGSNVTVQNVTNLDVCEDAISIKLTRTKSIPQNISILDSKFYDCEDKAIQITRGHNIYIRRNEFHRCAKAVRLQRRASNIYFEDNKRYDARIAVKVSGGSIISSCNVFDGAKVAY